MKRAAAVGVSPNRITLLRDADGDGVAEIRETFIDGLNQPFGMALVCAGFRQARCPVFRAAWRLVSTAPGTAAR